MQAINTIVPTVMQSPIYSQLEANAATDLAVKWMPELQGLPPSVQQELVRARLNAEHPDVKPLLKPAEPLSANEQGYQQMQKHSFGQTPSPAMGVGAAVAQSQASTPAAPAPAAPAAPQANQPTAPTQAELNEAGYRSMRAMQLGGPLTMADAIARQRKS